MIQLLIAQAAPTTDSWNMNARIAVIALVVALGKDLVAWGVKKWNNRRKLRFDIDYSDYSQAANPVARFFITMYYDKGTPFNLQKFVLDLVVREPNESERATFSAKNGGQPCRIAFSKPELYPLDSSNGYRPFERGNFAQFAAEISPGNAWELINPSESFASVRFISQGKLVRQVDVSARMRLCRDIAIRERKAKDMLICDPDWHKRPRVQVS